MAGHKNKAKAEEESKIHEPLSSYDPSPFKVDEPTLQNVAPPYYGTSRVYKAKAPQGIEKKP